jgi:hypothetical protein
MIRVVHPGFRIQDPNADFLPIPDPGSRGQKGSGSRIRIRNTGSGFTSRCAVRTLGSFVHLFSVVDPNPQRSALIWMSWMRIWICIGNANLDPDPEAWKLTKFKKKPGFLLFKMAFVPS